MYEQLLKVDLDLKVRDIISNNAWNTDGLSYQLASEIEAFIKSIPIPLYNQSKDYQA